MGSELEYTPTLAEIEEEAPEDGGEGLQLRSEEAQPQQRSEETPQQQPQQQRSEEPVSAESGEAARSNSQSSRGSKRSFKQPLQVAREWIWSYLEKDMDFVSITSMPNFSSDGLPALLPGYFPELHRDPWLHPP